MSCKMRSQILSGVSGHHIGWTAVVPEDGAALCLLFENHVFTCLTPSLALLAIEDTSNVSGYGSIENDASSRSFASLGITDLLLPAFFSAATALLARNVGVCEICGRRVTE